MSCGVGCRRGSDPALLWLWRRPVATALIRTLAWEPSYAARVAQEMAKRQKKKKKELQLPATATARATQDPSHVSDLYRSSQQCWILNPLSEARDRTRVLVDTSQIHFCCATTGTP